MSTGRFTISSGGKTYGPYDHDTLRDFVAQKRLAHQTLVAPEGSQDFRPALQFPELRRFFGPGGTAEKEEAAGQLQTPASTFLVVLGQESAGAAKAAELLRGLAACHELSSTAYIVRTEGTADGLRERLSTVLPSTERALVLTARGGEIASHGIALSEHEDIRTLVRE